MKKAIAVIDLSVLGLFIYDIPKDFNNEQIETFLDERGHHGNNCSWGEFDGKITDLRGELYGK